jgi:predicted amidohydrolase
MRNLKVALVQANQTWEDKAKNLTHFDDLIASIESVDLILLPEMFQTAFSMNVEALAESENDSTSLNWLKMISLKKSAAIYTSMIMEENGSFYNRGVFVKPSGEVITYNKRKLFGLAGEDNFFTPGDKAVIVDFEGWKFNLQICYDLRFPEMARNRIAPNGSPIYDVLLYVANWPEKRSAHWKALLTARAIENQCYTIGLNRVGKDGKGLTYSGDSMLIDPLGEKTECSPNQEEVLVLELKRYKLTEVRQELPFLKDL